MSNADVTVTARTKLGLILGRLSGTPCPSVSGFLGVPFYSDFLTDVSTVGQEVTLATDDVAQVLITVEGTTGDFRPINILGQLGMGGSYNTPYSPNTLVGDWYFNFTQTVTEPQPEAPAILTLARSGGGDLSILESGLGIVSAAGLAYPAQLVVFAVELP